MPHAPSLATLLALAVSLPVLAGDSAVRFENDRVRVLASRYAAGESRSLSPERHRLVVFLGEGSLEASLADGTKRTLDGKAGSVVAIAPATRTLKSARALPTIEIELLAVAQAPPLGDPLAEDPKHTVLLLEDERVKVVRTRLDPGEATPMHGHGERVTVILSGGRMKTQVEGAEASESELTTNEVSFRPPTRHLATNIGTTLHDAITVELKPPDRFSGLAKQVADTERAFARTMATRDLAAFRTFLSTETIFFSGEKPLRGPEQVVGHWKRYFEGAEPPFSWEPEVVEVLDSGTLALSSGPVRNPKGEQIATFTSIWRLETAGVWKIIFDKGCESTVRRRDSRSPTHAALTPEDRKAALVARSERRPRWRCG